MVSTEHKQAVTERLMETQYGKGQRVHHQAVTSVIDDMMTDSYWRPLLEEYAKNPANRQSSAVKTGFSLRFILFGK